MTKEQPKAAAPLPLADLPVVTPGDGFKLLEGVTVLDLTTSIAGPYATMLLSDFGAEVIKVEKPGGDDAREWGPPFLSDESLWFASVNRNKKSIVADMSTEEGYQYILDLVSQADAMVTNQPLRTQRKLGLDYETLKEGRPDLVFTSITGFGLTGKRSELNCYDLIAEGYSGIMDVTGEADSPPQKIGAPAADMLAGQDAAMATIAALFDRQRSGDGRLIDVSLVESMARFLTCRVSTYLGSGEVPVRSGGKDSVIAIYQQFETLDLPITLGLGTDGIWKRFWEAVGEPEYAAQRGMETNASRRQQRQSIVAKIQNVLKTRQRNEWLNIFSSHRVPAGPINRVDEAAADKALQERGLFFALNDSGRLLPQIGLGIQIDGQPSRPRSAPPRLGEHNDEFQ